MQHKLINKLITGHNERENESKLLCPILVLVAGSVFALCCIKYLILPPTQRYG